MLLPYDIMVDVITTEEDVTFSIVASWQMLLPYDIVVDVETTLKYTYTRRSDSYTDYEEAEHIYHWLKRTEEIVDSV